MSERFKRLAVERTKFFRELQAEIEVSRSLVPGDQLGNAVRQLQYLIDYCEGAKSIDRSELLDITINPGPFEFDRGMTVPGLEKLTRALHRARYIQFQMKLETAERGEIGFVPTSVTGGQNNLLMGAMLKEYMQNGGERRIGDVLWSLFSEEIQTFKSSAGISAKVKAEIFLDLAQLQRFGYRTEIPDFIRERPNSDDRAAFDLWQQASRTLSIQR